MRFVLRMMLHFVQMQKQTLSLQPIHQAAHFYIRALIHTTFALRLEFYQAIVDKV